MIPNYPYPYSYIDQLAYFSSPENITNREVIRAHNEVGLAICDRLDKISTLLEELTAMEEK